LPDHSVLHVVFTMNCLPAGVRKHIRGPRRWDAAAKAPAAFAKALDEAGLKATFFFAPEALRELKSIANDLHDEAFELGLLCHPQLSGYQTYLGSYSYERQREIVALDRDTWSQRMGMVPTTFRPGFFSANDYTYHVLCMEGFRQGSCSLPGRIDDEQCSRWLECPPFPHHTDPLDRSAAGTMEFFEAPVTSDFEAASFIPYETYTPPHLRIEEPDLHSYARDLILRHLSRMLEDQIELKVINFVTSNLVGWGQDEDPHVDRLRNLCAMLREIADERGMTLQWASLEALHRKTDRLLGVPDAEEDT